MRLWKVAFALAVVIGLLVPVAAQNLEADLQRAIQRETVSGDLTVAIREYQEIANRSSSNPSVASRALLRLAAVYERQGDRQATAVYERIVRETPARRTRPLRRRRGSSTWAQRPVRARRWRGSAGPDPALSTPDRWPRTGVKWCSQMPRPATWPSTTS